MRSHRRRGPLPHVLVAADVAEVEALGALLALLPETSYGQVFIELPQGAETPVLSPPARVTVTCLTRSEEQPGRRLADAVSSWVREWMPDEEAADRDLAVWAGTTARADLRLPSDLLLPL